MKTNEIIRYRFLNSEGEHLHQLNVNGYWKPLIGTTTALSVLSKNLTWWSAELAAIECLEAGEGIPTIREEYLNACSSSDKKKAIDELQKKYPIFKKARFAHFKDRNDKAEKGTNLHEKLEGYIKRCINENGGQPINALDKNDKVSSFIYWSAQYVKKFIGSEVYCYSEKLWIGGIADCLAELKDGSIVLIDFKSSKESYSNHFIQLGGYDLQLSENGGLTSNGETIIEPIKIDSYIVIPFGADKFKVDVKNNLSDYIEAFRNALELYKLLEIKRI